jgi:integrase
VPRDTRTRFAAVYARHRQDCPIEHGAECDCSPSFWGVVYDRASGKQRKTRMAGTPTAARDARTALAAALRQGGVPASSSLRVSGAIDTFVLAIDEGSALNKHGRPYKPSAIRDLRGALQNHVRPELGAKRLQDVRRADVQRLVDRLTPAKSGSRVRTVVNAIHSLYGWAQDRELAHHDPAQTIRLPAIDATARDRVATVAEMTRLLDALDPTDAVPFALAAYAGARRGEIRHLRVGDVDLNLGVLYLGVDEHARKSRAARRVVPVVERLNAMIRRLDRSDSDELLVPGRRRSSYDSGRLSFEALQERADAKWAAASLTRITAHECRHTFVSWLDAAGVRQSVISRLAGHAMRGDGAQVTSRYTHSLPGDLEQARALFEALPHTLLIRPQ